jgi:hypothetical protein
MMSNLFVRLFVFNHYAQAKTLIYIYIYICILYRYVYHIYILTYIYIYIYINIYIYNYMCIITLYVYICMIIPFSAEFQNSFLLTPNLPNKHPRPHRRPSPRPNLHSAPRGGQSLQSIGPNGVVTPESVGKSAPLW